MIWENSLHWQCFLQSWQKTSSLSAGTGFPVPMQEQGISHFCGNLPATIQLAGERKSHPPPDVLVWLPGKLEILSLVWWCHSVMSSCQGLHWFGSKNSIVKFTIEFFSKARTHTPIWWYQWKKSTRQSYAGKTIQPGMAKIKFTAGGLYYSQGSVHISIAESHQISEAELGFGWGDHQGRPCTR